MRWWMLVCRNWLGRNWNCGCFTKNARTWVKDVWLENLKHGNRKQLQRHVSVSPDSAVMPLYAFFWVIPRHPNFICWCFGTLCVFHLHGQVGVKKHSSHLPAYEDGTESSETSAYKIQTPGNYPEESIQHSEHSESLKSRLCLTNVGCNTVQRTFISQQKNLWHRGSVADRYLSTNHAVWPPQETHNPQNKYS